MRAPTSDLTIEDTATYYELRTIGRPGPDQKVTENVLSGFQVREEIRSELAAGNGEVEQTNPAEIVIRWADDTQRCTYSKLC
ncbi:hypothetical protein M2168_002182 [Streptomyces sp. CZ24]|nr:hypothetical protein [Streptomyces sp. CZ24]MDH6189150.1 hypothetical protein [Streptomyces sp. CZ24]